MNKPDNYIEYSKGATSFVGPDATACFRAMVLASALKMYGEHKILPNRNLTPKNMLVAAQGITGKKYKRGEHLQAAADVRLWALEMRAALPQLAGGLDSNVVLSHNPGGKSPSSDGGTK